ncbi:MAG TPA: glycosyltransferase family 2 protein [Bacteroidia bacterium]|jgi:teichuronic acid biosynthesis glycosyltransferase TuaG|nr:glycosyltransferase family 2 protein [Bacteroidia bacterium]
MPGVSVIIPTYNREKTLLRAVNSVLQQTRPAYEILICDDGSDDNSKSSIAALNNSKIKWLDCGKNGMPSIPRNRGIKAASGEWVAFLDSDDEWLPEKLETQLNTLAKDNTQACSTNAFRIVNDKNCGPYFNSSKNKIGFFDLLPVNLNICSSVIVSKKILEEVSLFPEGKEYKAIEDYALWLRLSLRTDFSYVSKPLVNYHDNPQASVRTEYTDVWSLRNVIFTGFTSWIEENRIVLSEWQKKQLLATQKEIEKKGKISLLQRIKQKFK